MPAWLLPFSTGDISLLSISLLASSAQLFGPAGISPDLIGTAALQAAVPFGTIGLLLALLGMFFAISGAAIETCLANAYSLGQFFGWRWGKKERPASASRFTLSWLAIFALALIVVMTGYDPVKLTEYSVIFSVVALPLTYLPILLVANDRQYMGDKVNSGFVNALATVYLLLLLVVAVATIPLMVLTKAGS